MQTPRSLAAALLFFACAPKSADTDGDTSTSSTSSGAHTDGAEATSATHTGPTTAPTTGVDPTTTAQTTTGPSDDTGPLPTTAATSTTTGTDTGDDTEGGGLFGACTAGCAHLDACDPGSVGPVEQCVETCNSVPFDALPECAPAIAAKWSCIATLSCEEAMKFSAGEPTSCTRAAQAAEVACIDQGCSGEGSGSGDSCEHSKVCNGLAQTIFCDADVCTCSENYTIVGECPADGLCTLGGDELPAAIEACCGWTP